MSDWGVGGGGLRGVVGYCFRVLGRRGEGIFVKSHLKMKMQGVSCGQETLSGFRCQTLVA